MEGEHEDYTTNSVYYSVVVEPGIEEHINIDEKCTLVFTNVCLGELPENHSNQSVRLVAEIATIKCADSSNPQVEKSTLLIASLIPDKIEHQHINITFSPLDDIKLKVIGEYSVHLSGYNVPIDSDDEDIPAYLESCEESSCDEEEKKENNN